MSRECPCCGSYETSEYNTEVLKDYYHVILVCRSCNEEVVIDSHKTEPNHT